jgi:4,5-dihydroxyphthalate decarboxylase
MSRIPLTVACRAYDRTTAIHDGRVTVRGADVTALDLPPADVFQRMLRHQEFDVAEMSLSSYIVSLSQPSPPFVALPVFLSRYFRHSALYVGQDSALSSLDELAGARVGVPEFQQTAGVWVRGILADEHDVPVNSVHYVQGGQEMSGRTEKVALSLPPDIDITPAPKGVTLFDLLRSGELDAVMTPRAPNQLLNERGGVRRLLTNARAEEEAYFRKTGIFPIMHVVAMKRALHERYPWLATELYQAFAAAKEQGARDLAFAGAHDVMLPWLQFELAATRDLMGEDYWPYGVERNRTTLTPFLRYMKEQGLTRSTFAPEDIFAHGADESTLI